MASAETLLTSDLIRQGGAKTQQKATKAENSLINNVKERLAAMEMKAWADVEILERARELGSAATVDRLVTDILDDPNKGSWQAQGKSNEGKKPVPRSSTSTTTRGPRAPRTGGKYEGGQSSRSNGTEGGDKSEYRRSGRAGDRKPEDSQQNGHRDETRRANGEHRARGQEKGSYGEKEGKSQQQQKPVAPVVPATPWLSIVKKNLPISSPVEETVVVSGKAAPQKDQSAAAANSTKNAKPNNKSKTSSEPTPAATTESTTTDSTPSHVATEAVVTPSVATPEPVAVETPAAVVAETTAAPVESTPAAAATAASEKKDETATGGRGRRNNRNRREKDAAAPAAENGAEVTQATPVETAAAAEKPAATAAAAAANTHSKPSVTMPSAFTGVQNAPHRRVFSSSHVKVTPVAAPAPAAAPAPVAVVAATAPAPEAQLLATAPAATTQVAPAPATGTNPVATTVPPAITSSLPPHMAGTHNAMPHGMFNMHYPGQFFQPQEYFQPEMYSHMMGPYPPFMPMGTGPRAAHDNKSPASTNPQSTNPSGPSPLNSQSGGMPMFPPYMMNPLPYYPMPFPAAAMQSQGPNTSATNGHYNPQQPRYNGRAPANPTPTYDQEESHFYQPRGGYADAYSTGGYPTTHHAQAHSQEQKPYGQDPNKSYEDHSHSYNAFGHGGSFSH